MEEGKGLDPSLCRSLPVVSCPHKKKQSAQMKLVYNKGQSREGHFGSAAPCNLTGNSQSCLGIMELKCCVCHLSEPPSTYRPFNVCALVKEQQRLNTGGGLIYLDPSYLYISPPTSESQAEDRPKMPGEDTAPAHNKGVFHSWWQQTSSKWS
jgi:hypothetical protein